MLEDLDTFLVRVKRMAAFADTKNQERGRLFFYDSVDSSAYSLQSCSILTAVLGGEVPVEAAMSAVRGNELLRV